ncbi:MAG: nicotinate-nucleotide adenylyltransferase [Acidimicrobiales bacterium]
MSVETPPTPSPKRRIGLFGGTFDPPHVGHLLTGQSVAEHRNYDQLWFVVANDPWQKRAARNVSPAEIRLMMVDQACYWSRHPHFALKSCETEIRAGGPSYTADTLRTLQGSFPGTDFEVIVGSDAGAQLHTWHDSAWLAERASFVMVQRGGQRGAPSPGFRVSVVDAPLIEVSSTDIRHRVSAGLPIANMVSPPVEALLRAHGLYKELAP